MICVVTVHRRRSKAADGHVERVRTVTVLMLDAEFFIKKNNC